MKKITPPESSGDSMSYDLGRVLLAVFAGILFLGVFALEKALGDDRKDPDEGLVRITRFEPHPIPPHF